jgi:hypothetical protein
VCCGAIAATANTPSMNASGTSSWNRSDIELTKMRRGFFHRSGIDSVARSPSAILPVQTGPAFDCCVRPWYFAWGMVARRAATRIA